MKVGQPLPGPGPQMHPPHLKCSYFVFFCKMHKVRCRETLETVCGAEGNGHCQTGMKDPAGLAGDFLGPPALARQECKHTWTWRKVRVRVGLPR